MSARAAAIEPLTLEQVELAAEAAGRAPSVHNTQPWRISVRHGDLFLTADPDRRLPVADPDGREMLISCGAALYDLVLALRHLGHRPTVRLLPDPDHPRWLALVHPDGGPPGPEGDASRYAAIPRRRTHIGGFSADPLPTGLFARLRRAAEHERADLTAYTAAAEVRALATVTELAAYVHARDTAYAAEHARWSHDSQVAFTYAEPDAGTVALLATPSDLRADWLYAGIALQRVLLEAAASGVAAAIHTQPLEIPHLRAFVGRAFSPGRHPQALLRFGRPAPGPPKVSTRRPVRDYLTVIP